MFKPSQVYNGIFSAQFSLAKNKVKSVYECVNVSHSKNFMVFWQMDILLNVEQYGVAIVLTSAGDKETVS